jgi:ACT domain-containing protein
MKQLKDNPGGNRIVITVIGPDRVGIIAAVSAMSGRAECEHSRYQPDYYAGILCYGPGGRHGYGSTIDLVALKDLLAAKGEELKVRIDAQHEDVFNFMHRI